MEQKAYIIDTRCDCTITHRVKAESKEEAIKKVKQGNTDWSLTSIDDIISISDIQDVQDVKRLDEAISPAEIRVHKRFLKAQMRYIQDITREMSARYKHNAEVLRKVLKKVEEV